MDKNNEETINRFCDRVVKKIDNYIKNSQEISNLLADGVTVRIEIKSRETVSSYYKEEVEPKKEETGNAEQPEKEPVAQEAV